MTALAQRIKETPMAEADMPSGRRQVPAEFRKLRGMVNITEEDMAKDELVT